MRSRVKEKEGIRPRRLSGVRVWARSLAESREGERVRGSVHSQALPVEQLSPPPRKASSYRYRANLYSNFVFSSLHLCRPPLESCGGAATRVRMLRESWLGVRCGQ